MWLSVRSGQEGGLLMVCLPWDVHYGPMLMVAGAARGLGQVVHTSTSRA